MTVRTDLKRFRENAEDFIDLARELSAVKSKSAIEKRNRDLLLADARATAAMAKRILAQADDVRSWARSMFGKEADAHPIAEFASKVITRAVASAMNQQSYRIRRYLSGAPTYGRSSPGAAAITGAITGAVE